MNREIKDSHILVVGAGHTLKLYEDKIKEFIENNNIITFGCNNINHILTPDYHFWDDAPRYKEFGGNMDENSMPVFSHKFSKKFIKKHWNKSYLIEKHINKKRGKWYDDPDSPKYGKMKVRYKNGVMYGYFRTVGAIAIFYAHLHGASQISVVGMDGYTLYSDKELKENGMSQHCYGKGYTDFRNKTRFNKEEDLYEQYYDHCVKKDRHIYNTLHSLEKYGVEFEIITPTVYEDFYNPLILNI